MGYGYLVTERTSGATTALDAGVLALFLCFLRFFLSLDDVGVALPLAELVSLALGAALAGRPFASDSELNLRRS